MMLGLRDAGDWLLSGAMHATRTPRRINLGRRAIHHRLSDGGLYPDRDQSRASAKYTARGATSRQKLATARIYISGVPSDSTDNCPNENAGSVKRPATETSSPMTAAVASA